MKSVLVVCTTDSMIWNFLVPHIRVLEEHGYYVECASSITGHFFEDLQKEYKIKMNEIPFERSPYKFANLKAYKLLCDLIKKKKFDIIFCHEPVGGAMGRLAGHSCRCKVIYMAHGFHFYKGAPKSCIVYYWVEKYLSKYTDILITINNEDYNASLKFAAKKNIKINGIGVDTSKFKRVKSDEYYFKVKYNLPEKAVTILSVGEIIPRKNYSVIIKALAQNADKNIFYFIAGEGKMSNEIQKLINEMNLEKKVYLLGYRTDISRLCNSADIFAMPSVHEGLSVALMEAMGCGKPVIVSNIRGNIDLVDDGKGGYLVSTYDIEQYAEKIRALVQSDKLREQFGLYNEEKVKQFDLVCIKQEIYKLF